MIYNTINRSVAQYESRISSGPFVRGFSQMLVTSGDFNHNTVVHVDVVTADVMGHKRKFAVVTPTDEKANDKSRFGFIYGLRGDLEKSEGTIVLENERAVLLRVRAGFRYNDDKEKTVATWDGHHWRVSDLLESQAEAAIEQVKSIRNAKDTNGRDAFVVTDAGQFISTAAWFNGWR